MSAEQQLESLVFASHPRAVDEPFPPGVIAVLTREVGTFKDFLISYRALLVPTGTGEALLSNGEKVASRNGAVEALLANPQCDWLYFMDDDHKFEPRFLLNQLAKMYHPAAGDFDFDVLGALYLMRLAPTDTFPVGGIFRRDREHRIHIRNLEWADMPAAGDVLERRDLTMGAAGLLIRRRVFEILRPPYFQVGQVVTEKEFEDLYFVIRCQEAGAGFRVGMNVSQCLGHTARCTLWAQRDGGEWHVAVDMDRGREPLGAIARTDAVSRIRIGGR